ncbi:MAG TPA: TlpA disulfide reductase family protein [Pseudobdellovibrionaceae bacterium]|nr:TlpA disulfide reductase family protein [Pseudobdellovibrionaceae bacterium]
MKWANFKTRLDQLLIDLKNPKTYWLFLKGNILLLLVIGFFLYQRIPVWMNEAQTSGKKLESIELIQMDGSIINTQSISTPHIYVFWATWCGPCKIEMKRLQSAINNQEIEAKNITAVSYNEDNETLKKSIQENQYTFNFAKDTSGKFHQLLGIRGTPTVVHINQQGEVSWMNVGLSLLGVQKAKSLFSKK